MNAHIRVKAIAAFVTDTNHRPCEPRTIRVVFIDGLPTVVLDGDRDYVVTGKRGINRNTGLDVIELATPQDQRAWITLGGTHLYKYF